MYGGTCINIGCIPTKKLIHTAADAKKNQQADYSEKNNFYAAAIREKNTLTALLRQKTMIMSLQLQIFIPVPPVFRLTIR